MKADATAVYHLRGVAVSPESEIETDMRLALRVLLDLTEGQQPAASDVTALYRIAGAGSGHPALDEVCCKIIQAGIWLISARKRSTAA